MAVNVLQVSKKLQPARVERYWIGDRKRDLEVYQIPIEYL
jgi:hypothetical protein